ncbi:MAG: DUF4435 domain-containing protein [Runella slithyformis]|nr:MAG: DUF4435 domain-containing protein [Runella slithyformis]
MRNIGEIELSEPLIIAIHQAGNRKLILVEGDEDQDIFEGYFKKYLSQICFFDCGGVNHILKYLEELSQKSTSKEFFGVRDRDFLDDNTVENSYSENSQLFILRWYCIENYLLNEQSIFDELCTKHKKNARAKIGFRDIEDITNYIGELKESLCAITAADWVTAEFNEERAAQNINNSETERVAYFSEGFDYNRENITRQLYQKLGLSGDKVIELIEQKENLLLSQDILHTKYSGKRLIHWICKRFDFRDKEHFKRLLISRLNTKNIPSNLKEIVEGKILKIQSLR